MLVEFCNHYFLCFLKPNSRLPAHSSRQARPGGARRGQAGQDFGDMYVLGALGLTVCFRKHFGDVKTLPRSQIRWGYTVALSTIFTDSGSYRSDALYLDSVRYTVHGRGAKRRTSSDLTTTYLTLSLIQNDVCPVGDLRQITSITENFQKVQYQA